MQTKLFEVRDRGTFIPVMAVRFTGADAPLLRAAGFGTATYVLFTQLTGTVLSEYDPHCWPSNPRTLREAHLYIEKHWDSLADGAVVDVEFLLNETTAQKESQL